MSVTRNQAFQLDVPESANMKKLREMVNNHEGEDYASVVSKIKDILSQKTINEVNFIDPENKLLFYEQMFRQINRTLNKTR